MGWRYQGGFSSGEIPESFEGRVESDIFKNSARIMRNAICERGGPNSKRYGSLFVAPTQSTVLGSNVDASVAHYIAYPSNAKLHVVLEITDASIYLYDGDTGLPLNGGVPLASPWTNADLPDLLFVPLPDELLIFHENYETRSFTVVGSPPAFALGLFDTAQSGPRLSVIRKLVTITRGTSLGGELFEWDANTDYWRETDENSIFWMEGGFVRVADLGGAKIFMSPRKVRGNRFVSNPPNSNGPTENWQGQWHPEVNASGAVASPAVTAMNQVVTLTRASGVFSKDDVGKIIDPTPTSAPFTIMFLIVEYLTTLTVKGMFIGADATSAGGAGDAHHKFYTPTQRDKIGRAMLTPSAKTGTITIYSNVAQTFESSLDDGTEQKPLIFINGGVARLVSVVSDREITATVVRSLMHQIPMTTWAVGPCMTYGFPRFGLVHQNRLAVFGFKGRFGRAFALSRSSSYRDFTPGPIDDDAINAEIVGEEGRLACGYTVGEDMVIASDSAKLHLVSGFPITPTSIGVSVQDVEHGAPVRMFQIGKRVCFVDKHREEIFATHFRFESGKYEVECITARAAHLFPRGSIRDVMRVDSPSPVYLIVRDDATVVAMSMDESYGLLAFNEWTGMKVISACVVPRDSGDVVFACVERTVGGATKKYLEVIDPSIPFLDCAIRYSSPGATLSGLSHLDGETIRVHSDGADLGAFVVSASSAALGDSPGTEVFAGLGYDWRLRMQSLPDADESGASNGREEGISDALILCSADTDGIQHSGRDVPGARRIDAEARSKWLKIEGMKDQARAPFFDLIHSKSTPCRVIAANLKYRPIGES